MTVHNQQQEYKVSTYCSIRIHYRVHSGNQAITWFSKKKKKKMLFHYLQIKWKIAPDHFTEMVTDTSIKTNLWHL